MSEKSILIFLPDYQENHFSYYSVLVNDVLKDYHKTIIASAENINALDNSDIGKTTILVHQNNSLLLTIIKKWKYFKNADLIIWEEIYSRFKLLLPLLLLFSKKSILTIHNLNKWLNRGVESSQWTSSIIKHILSGLKGLIVVGPNLKDYIINNDLYKGNVYYIPFSSVRLFKRVVKNKSDRIRIVIPGTVNSNRRDYKSFLIGLLNYTKIEDKNKPIDLIFLGKLMNLTEEEFALINQICDAGHSKVLTFKDYLSNSEFEEQVMKADFLLGNLVLNYSENNIGETYGSTKESGVVFLMLKYQVPTFLPNGYMNHPIFEDLIIHYQKNESYIINDFYNLVLKHYGKVQREKHNARHKNMFLEEKQKLLRAIN